MAAGGFNRGRAAEHGRQAQGIHGGSAFRASAGFGRHGVLHEEHFFELSADLNVVVGFVVSEADLDRELASYAKRAGRTTAAVRAGLEKEGGMGRLQAGMRREKAVDFLLSHARIERE